MHVMECNLAAEKNQDLGTCPTQDRTVLHNEERCDLSYVQLSDFGGGVKASRP